MSHKIDLTGQRFGRLVVLEEAPKKNGVVAWLCQCDCGVETIVRGHCLRRGDTKSCGCFNKERSIEAHTIHGHTAGSNSLTFNSWYSMMNRCYLPNQPYYHLYGGKGVNVCERWHSFESFLEDMGERPEGKTIDRIDDSGGYDPSNCRWATYVEQSQNLKGKGYCWDKKRQKWQASIKVNYKNIYLGHFGTPEEARQAYIEAKWKYHGVWMGK